MNTHIFVKTVLLSAALHTTGLQSAATENTKNTILAFCPNAPIAYIKQQNINTEDLSPLFTAELLKTLAQNSDNRKGELIFTKMKMGELSSYSGVFTPKDCSHPIVLKPSIAREMFYSLLLNYQDRQ